jgi:U6 snRNA-associated Sm-like protein LSm6
MDDSPRAPSEESPPPGPSQSHTGSPTDFLKGVVGKRVIVRLISGVDYRGKHNLAYLARLHVTDLHGY